MKNIIKQSWWIVLFLIFVVIVFTNWFGFGRKYDIAKNTTKMDCSKYSENRYCNNDFEKQNNQFDNAGRTINP